MLGYPLQANTSQSSFGVAEIAMLFGSRPNFSPPKPLANSATDSQNGGFRPSYFKAGNLLGYLGNLVRL